MKTRAIIPLLMGLGIGVFAVKSFLSLLNKAKGSGQVEMVEVVRAGVDISPTVEITASMLETTSVPKSLVPGGAFTDAKKLVGRVTTSMIPSGIPVVPSLLAPKGTLPGMASRIPEGYRAVAVQVDEIAGVAGWLKPGSRVDMVLVMTSKLGGQSRSISKVVLQNVEILAVGQEAKSEGTKASVTRSVTVLVTPEDATKLTLASSKGKLRLAMRNQTDYNESGYVSMTDKDLMEGTTPKKRAQGRDHGPSFLNQLFAKVPKIDRQQTDKKEPGPPEVAPVEVAAAPETREWVVEVLSGSDAYLLQFESDGKDARQMAGPTGRQDRLTRSSSGGGPSRGALQGSGASSNGDDS